MNLSGKWYHGSNCKFEILRTGSTITQNKRLAEAFSHKPLLLCMTDDGRITHNGKEKGFLYMIDEPIVLGRDMEQHPNSSMENGVEFLTKRPLKLKLVLAD